MRARTVPVVVIVLAAPWWTGCASGLAVPGKEAREQIERLEERVMELQRQATVNEVEIDRLREQVAALEATRPSRSRRESGSAIAEASPPSRSIVVVEPVEEEEIETPSVPPRDRAEDPEGLEEELPAEESGDSTRPGSPPTAPEDDEPLGASGQAIYDEAYTLYHQGRYQEAERAFHRFLEENPRTELSDNAQYWIGASRFARGDYAGALRAFRETVERYPEANKVPDALYKVGQSLEEIGDPAAARQVYEDLAARFPTTAAASLATDRLEALR